MNNKTHLKHKRRNKKLLLLFMVFGISILAFIGITYAWFIGISQVKINSFTINLKTDKALEISLDGYTWGESINVTKDTIKAHSDEGDAYEDNTNSWVGETGLVPVSSSGDNVNGRLTFFSKSALTSSNGGYQLVADSIDNSTTEVNYYVAFDIFVKNKTGDVYNPTYNFLDDEDIYLTSDSSIIGTAAGATSYGIQNSARVAFVQIGRIDLDNLESGTTPVIKCTTPQTGETYTPLCNENTNKYRTAIWEPNELDHDSKLVNYYNYICHKKNLDGTYTEQSCVDITAGYVPTYTIKKNILSSDNVDVYDGLNYYTNDISLPNETAKSLQQTETFTDTMKLGGWEYTLMKLHPHSVTKIRVYVYLEGQDVDNYDLITNDLNIVVNFGLTKERTEQTLEIPEDSLMGIALKNSTSTSNVEDATNTIIAKETPFFGEKATSNVGLFKSVDEDGPVYYYRGAVNDNHVIFAGFCWKIVRTTGTGGVKMIYDGPPVNGVCNNGIPKIYIKTIRYNSSYTSLADVGYMHGNRIYKESQDVTTDIYVKDKKIVFSNDVTYNNSTGKYELDMSDAFEINTSDWNSTDNSKNYTNITTRHYSCLEENTTSCGRLLYVYAIFGTKMYYIPLYRGQKVEDAVNMMISESDNSISSPIKAEIDNWFGENLTSYSSYLEDTVFCNDRSIIHYGGWDKDSTNYVVDQEHLMQDGTIVFGTAGRTYFSNTPSLICPRLNDKFTVSEKKGNGDLTYPVGLLTADELIMAGGKYNSSNSGFYLYATTALDGRGLWTMSPFKMYGDSATVVDTYQNGSVIDSVVISYVGVRPVISLKPGTMVSGGDGTSTNPYIVQTN